MTSRAKPKQTCLPENTSSNFATNRGKYRLAVELLCNRNGPVSVVWTLTLSTRKGRRVKQVALSQICQILLLVKALVKPLVSCQIFFHRLEGQNSRHSRGN